MKRINSTKVIFTSKHQNFFVFTYSVYFPKDVSVFNDNQQFAVSVFLAEEGDGTLLHVALLQQMFLQQEDTVSK